MASFTVDVALGERSYPVVIGQGLLGNYDLAAHVAGPACLVVSNETVAPLWFDALAGSLGGLEVDSLALDDGEQYKTLDSFGAVIDRLVGCRAGRDVTLVALGGGVVGDIAGFAAACYMRGVDFVQVPTTLLAQVDSSVGGKTGVNHPGGKNLVGAFHQPRAVLIDTDTLSTLPDRELRAGLAEVIKYGAIADREFFDWLEEHIDALLERQPEALARAIRRCCKIKAEVVAADEREAGRRAILNFGHTFGHAIERCQGYGDWLHGEAVAAGMVMAAELSELEMPARKRLRGLIARAGLPVGPPPLAPAALREAMGLDKKAVAGRLRFVLLEALGSAVISADVEESRLATLLGTAGE